MKIAWKAKPSPSSRASGLRDRSTSGAIPISDTRSVSAARSTAGLATSPSASGKPAGEAPLPGRRSRVGRGRPCRRPTSRARGALQGGEAKAARAHDGTRIHGAAMDGYPADPRDLPGTRPPEARRADLRSAVLDVHLGLPDAGGDDPRSVEPERARASLRDFLLRAEVVPAVPHGSDSQGSRAEGNELGGGELGRRGSNGASRARRVSLAA